MKISVRKLRRLINESYFKKEKRVWHDDSDQEISLSEFLKVVNGFPVYVAHKLIIRYDDQGLGLYLPEDDAAKTEGHIHESLLTESDCPSCGSSGAYVGFSSVECTNSKCDHYKKPEKKKAILKPEFKYMSSLAFERNFPDQFDEWENYIRIRLMPGEHDRAVADRLEWSLYAEHDEDLYVIDTKENETYIWTDNTGWLPLEDFEAKF